MVFVSRGGLSSGHISPTQRRLSSRGKSQLLLCLNTFWPGKVVKRHFVSFFLLSFKRSSVQSNDKAGMLGDGARKRVLVFSQNRPFPNLGKSCNWPLANCGAAMKGRNFGRVSETHFSGWRRKKRAKNFSGKMPVTC